MEKHKFNFPRFVREKKMTKVTHPLRNVSIKSTRRRSEDQPHQNNAFAYTEHANKWRQMLSEWTVIPANCLLLKNFYFWISTFSLFSEKAFFNSWREFGAIFKKFQCEKNAMIKMVIPFYAVKKEMFRVNIIITMQKESTLLSNSNWEFRDFYFSLKMRSIIIKASPLKWWQNKMEHSRHRDSIQVVEMWNNMLVIGARNRS